MFRSYAPRMAAPTSFLFAIGLLLPALADDPKPSTKADKPAAKAPAAGKTEFPDIPKPTTRIDKPAPKAPAPEETKLADIPKPTTTIGPKPLSFMHDVAPILVENCIACHNPRKAESKYVMTTFAQLAKGGQQGEDVTLEPGEPDESYLVELIRPDAEPRMPYKLDPLPPEKIATIERWVREGAKYDGGKPDEDWTILLRKNQSISVPEAYPAPVPITALAFTPDGSAVAASGYHELTYWKAADGSPGPRLGGLAERTYDAAYSADGKWMATASGDPGIYGIARLWSVEPGKGPKPVRDLAETQDVVFSVSFSPDSKKVATAGADRAIRVFEVETGKLLFQVEDHADWIFAVAFSPDGKRLASASRDKTCKVFDVEKKESLVTFPGHGQPVYTLSFSPDGKSVVSGGEDNAIRIWNPDADAKQTKQVGGFGGTVFRLRFAPDGQTLVAASGDKKVHVFKANGSSIKNLDGHQDWIYSVAVSPDSKTIASGSWDGEVRLWNLADGKPLRTILAAPGLKPATTKAASR